MKKLLSVYLVSMSLSVIGQQGPVYSSEGFTPIWNNPASYGSWNRFSANIVGRNQWIGVHGAPKSLMMTTEFGELIQFDKKNITIPLGLSYLRKSVGSFNYEQIRLPVSFNFPIGKTFLSVGLSPGLSSLNYPGTGSTGFKFMPQSKFDLDAGICWYSEDFYAGFSMTHLTSPVYDSLGFRSVPHYNLHGTYRFELNSFAIIPMLRLYANSSSASFESINYFSFRDDLVAVGVGYRFGDAVLAAVAFTWKGVRIAYNYDYTLNPLNSYSKGTHEIRLSYIIEKKFD